MPYLVATSFLLNSFSYLIIPPPCLTMPRCCPPTYLFCCLLPYLFHYIPFVSASNTSSFLSVTNRANSCFTLGSLSFHTFSLGMCILFFFLGAELMMTSSSNRCCDSHSYQLCCDSVVYSLLQQWLGRFYNSFVTSSQQQVINCTHCTTKTKCKVANLFFCLLKQVFITISSIASQNSSICSPSAFLCHSHSRKTANNQLHSLYHQIHRWPICSFCLSK